MTRASFPLSAGDSDPELERLKAGLGGGYEWRADDSPTFFPGRHASVHFRGQRVRGVWVGGGGGVWVGGWVGVGVGVVGGGGGGGGAHVGLKAGLACRGPGWQHAAPVVIKWHAVSSHLSRSCLPPTGTHPPPCFRPPTTLHSPAGGRVRHHPPRRAGRLLTPCLPLPCLPAGGRVRHHPPRRAGGL